VFDVRHAQCTTHPELHYIRLSLYGLQHVGWHLPQHGTVFDCDILDGHLGHCTCDSDTAFDAVELHCVTFGERADLLFAQLGTSILYRIHNTGQLIVGEVTKHDCGIDLLDLCQLFHLQTPFVTICPYYSILAIIGQPPKL
jgi:hypothetical protein